jgi:serine protease Do
MRTADLDRDLAELTRFVRAFTVAVLDGRRSAGSGLIWDRDGIIVTNAHVVRSGRATIVFDSGRSVEAKVRRRSDALDLAVLQCDPLREDFSAAVVRDSADVVPGELAIAVGNPLGVTGAVTAGLVQRANRRWVAADVRLEPGNSGGPLADARGRVIGINSMTSGSLGYAVASSAVQAFLADARAKGTRAA